MKTLQIGRTYKDAQGHEYIVQAYEGEDCDKFPFKGLHKDGITFDIFTKYGKFFSYRRDSEFDLIIPDDSGVQQSVQTEVKPEVPHLDVILAIVQKIPVQYDYMLTGTWHDYSYTSDDLSPVNYPEYNWRIKPQPEPKRTIVIGKRTVVAPETKALEIGQQYFIPYDSYQFTWNNDKADIRFFQDGRVFLTKQSVQEYQEAISTLLLGKE